MGSGRSLVLAVAIAACLSLPGVADGAVPVNVTEVVRYTWGSVDFVEGVVHNPAGAASRVTTVRVTVQFDDASNVTLKTGQVPAACYVLDPGGPGAVFRESGPVGANHYHVWAVGEPTGQPRVGIGIQPILNGLRSNNDRWYRFRLTNHNSFNVVGVWPSVYERYTPPGGSTQYWGITLPTSMAGLSRLAPGEAVDVEVETRRPYSIGSYDVIYAAEALRAPPTSVVWRFYNKRTGTHFYTVDVSEKNHILANLGWLYSLDGPAYNAYPGHDLYTVPLYRFYNKRNGTHFYTADWYERQSIIDKLGWLYVDEGVAFFIADSGGQASIAVWRFYNKRDGTHFYTADILERESVRANLGWLYSFEGFGFYVPTYTP